MGPDRFRNVEKKLQLLAAIVAQKNGVLPCRHFLVFDVWEDLFACILKGQVNQEEDPLDLWE
jgi:hypothetical protein